MRRKNNRIDSKERSCDVGRHQTKSTRLTRTPQGKGIGLTENAKHKYGHSPQSGGHKVLCHKD